MNQNIYALQKIQDYIEEHLEEDLSLPVLAKLVGYSNSYLSRIFSNYIGMSLTDYIRSRRLTVSAERLADTDTSVLDVALDMKFKSHEGFSRAFHKQFGLNPLRYRMTTPPIPLFLRRSIREYHRFLEGGINASMSNQIIYVHNKTKVSRKLIYMNGINAEEYFTYCEEVGCEVWGILLSIKEGLYEPVGLWLPNSIRKDKISPYIQGVEVPLDYDGIVPEGMEVLTLPETSFIEFSSEPCPDEELYEAIGSVRRAIDTYDPVAHGYEWDLSTAIRYQHSPDPMLGYTEGVELFTSS